MTVVSLILLLDIEALLSHLLTQILIEVTQ